VVKAVAWAFLALLSVSLPLALLFFPVIDTAGPGWVGHVNLEFDVLKFVPVWKREGRPIHPGALLIEIGAGALAGIFVFAGFRGDRAVGRGGAV